MEEQGNDSRARSRGRKLAAGAAISVGATLIVVPSASANVYVVTNLTDNDAGSLRNLIQAANGNPGPDQIFFQSGLTGTITLDSNMTTIYGELQISGPSFEDITIDGGGQHRDLRLHGGPLRRGIDPRQRAKGRKRKRDRC